MRVSTPDANVVVCMHAGAAKPHAHHGAATPHARAYTHLHADRAPHKHGVPSRSHTSVHDVHVEVIYDAVNVDAVNVGNHVAKLAATFDPAPDTLPTPTLWPLGTAAIDSAMVLTTVMASFASLQCTSSTYGHVPRVSHIHAPQLVCQAPLD